jgi:hypothetical protein
MNAFRKADVAFATEEALNRPSKFVGDTKKYILLQESILMIEKITYP